MNVHMGSKLPSCCFFVPQLSVFFLVSVPYYTGKSTSISHVRLASYEDGRAAVISCAQQMCSAIANQQLRVDNIDVTYLHSMLSGEWTTNCATDKLFLCHTKSHFRVALTVN